MGDSPQHRRCLGFSDKVETASITFQTSRVSGPTKASRAMNSEEVGGLSRGDVRFSGPKGVTVRRAPRRGKVMGQLSLMGKGRFGDLRRSRLVALWQGLRGTRRTRRQSTARTTINPVEVVPAANLGDAIEIVVDADFARGKTQC